MYSNDIYETIETNQNSQENGIVLPNIIAQGLANPSIRSQLAMRRMTQEVTTQAAKNQLRMLLAKQCIDNIGTLSLYEMQLTHFCPESAPRIKMIVDEYAKRVAKDVVNF